MNKTKDSKNIEMERFQSDCLTYCEVNGIHALSKELLTNKCLRIPDNGIGTIHKLTNLKNTFYPIITRNEFDDNVERKIGHYNTNNDVIVFVYIDGSTYLTKDWKVFDELANNGYKRGNLPVPLSFGETILDPSLRIKWENLPKTND